MEIKRSGSQASPKARQTGSRARFGSIRFFRRRSRTGQWRQRDVRARCSNCMAYTSPRADTDHHGRLRLGTASRRARRRDSSGRRGLVLARREALARRHANHSDDAHRHSGEKGWQGRRLDGARHRRAIPKINSAVDGRAIASSWPPDPA